MPSILPALAHRRADTNIGALQGGRTTSFTLRWDAATDNVSPSSTIVYLVYPGQRARIRRLLDADLHNGRRRDLFREAVFERPDLRDELRDLGRAECGFRVRSAWAALAGGRVGEAANAGRRPRSSAADVVCVDWRPVVADTIGLDSLES
jgi:hypothetical protein